MLVETKGITELGLAFGNTWQVIGIVIGAILVMAWLGNWIAGGGRSGAPGSRGCCCWRASRPGLVFVAGRRHRVHGGRALDGGRCCSPALVLLGHRVQHAALADAAEASSALAMNLLGAMVGGVLEYNSMYFGFQSLYWLALSPCARRIRARACSRRHRGGPGASRSFPSVPPTN